MKNASIALFAGLALMACAPSSETTPAAPAPGPAAEAPAMPDPAPPAIDPAAPPADACGAAQYAALIGKPVTEPGVPAEGPNVRYIRPGTQVTMDFRADRLNIDIDAKDIITGFRCT
jgi:hypothetical protein